MLKRELKIGDLAIWVTTQYMMCDCGRQDEHHHVGIIIKVKKNHRGEEYRIIWDDKTVSRHGVNEMMFVPKKKINKFICNLALKKNLLIVQ